MKASGAAGVVTSVVSAIAGAGWPLVVLLSVAIVVVVVGTIILVGWIVNDQQRANRAVALLSAWRTRSAPTSGTTSLPPAELGAAVALPPSDGGSQLVVPGRGH